MYDVMRGHCRRTCESRVSRMALGGCPGFSRIDFLWEVKLGSSLGLFPKSVVSGCPP